MSNIEMKHVSEHEEIPTRDELVGLRIAVKIDPEDEEFEHCIVVDWAEDAA